MPTPPWAAAAAVPIDRYPSLLNTLLYWLPDTDGATEPLLPPCCRPIIGTDEPGAGGFAAAAFIPFIPPDRRSDCCGAPGVPCI
jgi:hypothetical protein